MKVRKLLLPPMDRPPLFTRMSHSMLLSSGSANNTSKIGGMKENSTHVILNSPRIGRANNTFHMPYGNMIFPKKYY